MIYMRQTKLLSTFVVICVSLAAASARADNGDAQVDKRDALAWLKKAQAAAQKLNYSGTFVYQQVDQVRTSRVTHIYDGKNEFEKLEIMDGGRREYIRKNDDVACYILETRTIQVDKKGFSQEFFPAMLAANSADLTDHYDVKKRDEIGRIAGFDCDIVELAPKDNLRYGYRLWIEKSTGLLLRAQTMNERREVVEQITFAQLAIGNIDKNAVHSSFANVTQWHVEIMPTMEASALNWSVTGVPPGFKKTHELKRMVPDRGNFPPGAPVGEHPVEQMIFSDGLAAISVFVEPSSQSGTEGFLQQGAVSIVGKRQGDYWLVVMGEVPSAAIQNVANSIEFKNIKQNK
jgi:sigma-E factor negative regulatory protein RseB